MPLDDQGIEPDVGLAEPFLVVVNDDLLERDRQIRPTHGPQSAAPPRGQVALEQSRGFLVEGTDLFD
jgi:hypothetical protein